MGVGLNRDVEKAFRGHHTIVQQFKGSERKSLHLPDAIYEPAEQMQQQKTHKESFKNRRAQGYFFLRDRIIRTYRAVVHGEYHDPDTLISFSSDIKILSKLRSELCRMPKKPNLNGLFELYKKEDLKSRFKFDSPNLADSVMMLMIPPYVDINSNVKMPQPIRPMGVGMQKERYRTVHRLVRS